MFTEDLSVYMRDFGVDATCGAVTAKVLFDSPEQTMADTVTAEYIIQFPTGTFPGIAYRSTVVISGVTYRVNHVQAIADGAFQQAMLSKP